MFLAYFKYIFHVKIQLFVTLKFDPDPHWFGSLIRIRIRIEIKPGSGSALKTMRIHTLKYYLKGNFYLKLKYR